MAEEEKIVVPADKPEISKKVKVDLEVDTSAQKLFTWQELLTLGEYFQDCS